MQSQENSRLIALCCCWSPVQCYLLVLFIIVWIVLVLIEVTAALLLLWNKLPRKDETDYLDSQNLGFNSCYITKQLKDEVKWRGQRKKASSFWFWFIIGAKFKHIGLFNTQTPPWSFVFWGPLGRRGLRETTEKQRHCEVFSFNPRRLTEGDEVSWWLDGAPQRWTDW